VLISVVVATSRTIQRDHRDPPLARPRPYTPVLARRAARGARRAAGGGWCSRAPSARGDVITARAADGGEGCQPAGAAPVGASTGMRHLMGTIPLVLLVACRSEPRGAPTAREAVARMADAMAQADATAMIHAMVRGDQLRAVMTCPPGDHDLAHHADQVAQDLDDLHVFAATYLSEHTGLTDRGEHAYQTGERVGGCTASQPIRIDEFQVRGYQTGGGQRTPVTVTVHVLQLDGSWYALPPGSLPKTPDRDDL
jgi:hypothetical protein